MGSRVRKWWGTCPRKWGGSCTQFWFQIWGIEATGYNMWCIEVMLFLKCCLLKYGWLYSRCAWLIVISGAHTLHRVVLFQVPTTPVVLLLHYLGKQTKQIVWFAAQVVYVTATLPYILIFAFLIRAVTLDGSYDGIIRYVMPEWDQLIKFRVCWLSFVVFCPRRSPNSISLDLAQNVLEIRGPDLHRHCAIYVKFLERKMGSQKRKIGRKIYGNFTRKFAPHDQDGNFWSTW